MARALIIANGVIEDYDWHRKQIHTGDLLICADGGANHARALGITPDLVVGDLDSIRPEVETELRERGCRFLRYPRNKDDTDTGLAIKHALERGCDPIVILGGIGNRLDHTLANISLITAETGKARIILLNEYIELQVISDRVVIEGQPGEQVSLLPLTEAVTGVTTSGLKWPLHQAVFRLGDVYGVSNELVSGRAEVTLEQGLLLVIKARDKR